MNLAFSDGVNDLHDTLRRWVDNHKHWHSTGAVFDRSLWNDFLSLGIIEAFGDHAIESQVAAFLEIGQLGLFGPLLEAALAFEAGGEEVRDALATGAVVTSVLPGVPGPTVVGWGAVADLVIDQTSGDVVARAPLPTVTSAFPLPHGWWERPAHKERQDGLMIKRWILGSALLVGLARGALDLTVSHTLGREQFGHPLAQNQAIQFPMAEILMTVEAGRLAALDAACRLDRKEESVAAAAALAWLWAKRTAETARRVCHQSFGALGFCIETGLVHRTWPISWLSLSIGDGVARRAVMLMREPEQSAGVTPEALVMRGFERSNIDELMLSRTAAEVVG